MERDAWDDVINTNPLRRLAQKQAELLREQQQALRRALSLPGVARAALETRVGHAARCRL
jgi:hypothetical protein